jgi:hypothetical protein
VYLCLLPIIGWPAAKSFFDDTWVQGIENVAIILLIA